MRFIRLSTLLAFSMSFTTPGKAQESRTADRVPWTLPNDSGIRALLVERMRDRGVGTVVGVISASGQRVVAVGTSGAADARQLDGETVFQIGSVTKVFTGLLLAEMSVRREVSLEEPAAMFLPEGVHMPLRGRPITLLDLSKHWSGLPSMPTNFSLSGLPDPYASYSEQQLYEFVNAYQLPREPGRQEYSNLGVALLGRLLARRAGISYEQLLRDRVLTPLALTSTSIWLDPDQRRRLAPGHDRFRQPVETWELLAMPASGSLRSTVNDLLRFLAFNMGLLESPLAEAMLLQRTPGRALGWGRSTLGGEAIYGHEGGKEGYRSAVVFHPEKRIGVVVLTNARTDESPMVIARHLLYGGDSLPPLPPAATRPPIVKLSETALDSYAGTYRLDSVVRVNVARRGDHLLVNEIGDGIVTYFPVGGDEFIANTEPARIRFGRDSDGRIATMTLHNGETERRGQRSRE